MAQWPRDPDDGFDYPIFFFNEGAERDTRTHPMVDVALRPSGLDPSCRGISSPPAIQGATGAKVNGGSALAGACTAKQRATKRKTKRRLDVSFVSTSAARELIAASRSSPKRPFSVLEAGTIPFDLIVEKTEGNIRTLPGAQYVLVDAFESWPDAKDAKSPKPNLRFRLTPSTGNLLPARQLRAKLESLGLTREHTVLIYTRDKMHPTRPHEGPIAGGRLAWILCVAGVAKVRLLDGGYPAWVAAKYKTSLGFAPLPKQESDFSCGDPGASFPANPDIVASTKDIEAAVACSSSSANKDVLADVRSWNEHIGRRHDYSYFSALGRIPGSRWGHWGPSTYVGGDFWDMTGSVQSEAPRIRKMWLSEGIAQPADQASSLVFYCGTGWRSSLAWFIATACFGWENVKNYDGGWLEWAVTHPRADIHPIVTNTPLKSSREPKKSDAVGDQTSKCVA